MIPVDDSLNQQEADYAPIKPVWVDGGNKNEKAFAEWLQGSAKTLLRVNQPRIFEMTENLLWYTGEWEWIYSGRRAIVPGKLSGEGAERRVQPMVINHLHDITEQRISRLSRYKPAFDVLPANEEYRDRTNAKLQKNILDFISRKQQADYKITEIERWNAIFGEIYLAIEWDKRAGEVRKNGEKTGDVVWKIIDPRWMFLDPKKQYEHCRWAINIHEVLHVDEARKKYGDKTIQPSAREDDILTLAGMYDLMKDDVVVWRFHYKPDEMLEEGLVALYCNGNVLEFENKKYPYSHRDFPWERHTDMDIPSRLYGASFYRNIKPMQRSYNKISAMIARNIALTAHPKWMMPKGACNVKNLGNAVTVVQYQGGVAPQLVAFPSTTPDVFQFRNSMREEMVTLAGIQGVSRGEPPPGVKAGIALQFLEEQEAARANTQIIKHNDLIRRAFLKTASVVGDYYPQTAKDRLIRIVGKNNEWAIRSLDGLKTSSGYDIIILNSTALSESKAGRIQQIIELNQYFQGLISPEQAADLLDLAQPNKFYDITTAAIKQAESENEDILDGRTVSHPQKFEDHINHWRTHMIRMQSRVFKEQVPEERQQELFDHVSMHEMLMLEILKTNPAYGQLLSQLPNFPIFFPLPPQLPAPVAGGVPPGVNPQVAPASVGGLPPDAIPPLEGSPATPPVTPLAPEMAANEQPIPGDQK